jgi:hypothetical protein
MPVCLLYFLKTDLDAINQRKSISYSASSVL